MSEFAFWAAAMKLGYACAALAAIILFLRWMNWTVGVRLSDDMRKIRSEPLPAAIYYGLRFLAVCILFGMLMGCSPASAAAPPPCPEQRYDALIRRAVDRWWPDFPDWLYWRAQLCQESRLRPDAVSPVGARGLAQFMPPTWREVAAQMRLPPGASPHQDIAIEAGAFYMARLRRSWSSPRPELERHRLAQASYNAGLGHILRAQTLCGGARDWADIAPCLPRVTGERNAHETTSYVTLIARWRAQMAAAGMR